VLLAESAPPYELLRWLLAQPDFALAEALYAIAPKKLKELEEILFPMIRWLLAKNLMLTFLQYIITKEVAQTGIACCCCSGCYSSCCCCHASKHCIAISNSPRVDFVPYQQHGNLVHVAIFTGTNSERFAKHLLLLLFRLLRCGFTD
jgi:hypothetical protein